MFLYRAVIDHADCQQLAAIRPLLAEIENRVDRLLPIRQFSLFQNDPNDVDVNSGALDLWIALEDGLTPPQLTLLEQEVETAVGLDDDSEPSKARPRVNEELTPL